MSTHTVQRSASTSAHLPYTPPRPTVSPVADDEPDEAWKANERSNIESGFKGLIQEAKDRLENALQELHKDGTFSPEKKAALVEAFQLETSFIKSLAKEEFEHNLGRERVTRRLTRGGVINSEVKGGLVEEQAAILEQIQRDRKNQGGPAQTGSPSASSSSPSQRAANVAQESFPRGAPPETGPASRNPPASASSPSTSNRDAPPRSPLPTSSSQEPSRDATAPQSLNGPSTDPRIPPSGSSPFYNGTRLPPSPQAWPMPAQERAPPATSSTFKVAAAALHSPDGVSPDPRAFSAGPSSSFSGTPFSQPPSQANAAPVQEWGKPAPTPTPSYAGASPISPHAPAAPTSASIHRAPTAQTRADASSPPVQAEHRPAVSFPLRSKPSQSSFKAPSVSAGKPVPWTRAEFTEEPEELPPSKSEQLGVPIPSARPREMSERPLGSSPPAARPMPEFWTPTVTPEEDAQASRPFGRERSGSSLRSASGSIRRPIPAFTEQAPASSPVVDVNKNAEREAAQRHESELSWNSLSRSREKEKEKAAEARASHRQSTASEQIYRHNNEHVSFPPSHSDGSSTSARPPDSDPGLHSNASSRFPLSSPDSAPSGSLSRAPYSFAASGISATAHPPSGSPASFARPSNGDSPYHASTGYAAEHHQYKPANVDPMPSDVPPAAAYRAPQPYSTSVTSDSAPRSSTQPVPVPARPHVESTSTAFSPGEYSRWGMPPSETRADSSYGGSYTYPSPVSVSSVDSFSLHSDGSSAAEWERERELQKTVGEAERVAKQAAEDAQRKAEEVRRKEEAAQKKEADLKRQQEETERRIREINEREADLRRREEDIRRREEETRQKDLARQREEVEKQRREKERLRAEAERQRAEAEKQRTQQKTEAEKQNEQLREFEQRAAEIQRRTEERRRQESMDASNSRSAPPRTFPSSTSPSSTAGSSARNGTTGSSTTGPTWSTSSRASSTSANQTSSSTRPSSTSTPNSKPTWTSTSTSTPPTSPPYSSTAGSQAGARPVPSSNAKPRTSSTSQSVPPPPANTEDWARRQREQAEEQFRKMQEQMEKERQAKEMKAGRIPTKEEVIRTYQLHEQQWAKMSSHSEVTWDMLPWPMLRKPGSPEEITSGAVDAYILSPHYPDPDKSTKDRVRLQLRRWHEDHFNQKVLSKVSDRDKERVKQAAGTVTRNLNSLLERANESKKSASGIFG